MMPGCAHADDTAVAQRCVDFFTDTVIPGLFREIAQLAPGRPIAAAFTAPIPDDLLAQRGDVETMLESMLAKFQRRWSASLCMRYAHVCVVLRERTVGSVMR